MAKKKTARIKRKKVVPREQAGQGDDEADLPKFEDSLEELEKVVQELESGQLSLSESLQRYEEGIRNLKTCHRILESAESRIRLLTGIDSEGNASTESFDETRTELDVNAEGTRGRKRSATLDETWSAGTGNEMADGDEEPDDNHLF